MSAACRAVLRSKTAVTSTEISPLPHKILHSQAFAGAPFKIRTGGCKDKCTEYAAVAHLVERHLAKVEVASSSLVGRSICGSLAKLGEHLPYKQRVSGSSPLTSTIFLNAGLAQLVEQLTCNQ